MAHEEVDAKDGENGEYECYGDAYVEEQRYRKQKCLDEVSHLGHCVDRA